MSVFLVQGKKYFPDEKYIEGATNKINKQSFDEENDIGKLEKIEGAFDDPTKLEKNEPYIIVTKMNMYIRTVEGFSLRDGNIQYIQAYFDKSETIGEGENREIVLYFNRTKNEENTEAVKQIRFARRVDNNTYRGHVYSAVLNYPGSKYLSMYFDDGNMNLPSLTDEITIYKIGEQNLLSLQELAAKIYKKNKQQIPLASLEDNDETKTFKEEAESNELNFLNCLPLENDTGNIKLDWIKDVQLVRILEQYKIKSFTCEQLKGGKKKKSKKNTYKKSKSNKKLKKNKSRKKLLKKHLRRSP